MFTRCFVTACTIQSNLKHEVTYNIFNHKTREVIGTITENLPTDTLRVTQKIFYNTWCDTTIANKLPKFETNRKIYVRIHVTRRLNLPDIKFIGNSTCTFLNFITQSHDRYSILQKYMTWLVYYQQRLNTDALRIGRKIIGTTFIATIHTVHAIFSFK